MLIPNEYPRFAMRKVPGSPVVTHVAGMVLSLLTTPLFIMPLQRRAGR